MPQSKDLFDESAMSFGEHLEVLRVHLWRAIIGLVVCVLVALFFGEYIIDFVRGPIDRALQEHGALEVQEDVGRKGLTDYMRGWFGSGGKKSGEEGEKNADGSAKEGPEEPRKRKVADPEDRTQIEVQVRVADLRDALSQAGLELRPPSTQPNAERKQETESGEPKAESGEPGTESPSDDRSGSSSDDRQNAGQTEDEQTIPLVLSSPRFAQLRQVIETQNKPITLNVQEAFLTYLKVSFIAGLLVATPWIFYQIWLFVAAGLYPHERRYVYVYLPMSVGLFVGGALFCFIFVFPYVLKFLLSFNEWMGIHPQIRLSEWISFALVLPLMFGISFQLPLVMLFLERISIFEVKDYREKRRMAILVIAILSMFLTPADPMSMMLMMLPLLALYELGIFMCTISPVKTPFGTEAA